MIDLAWVEAGARRAGLRLRGAFHPGPDDAAPEGCETLLLLGPDEPAFWDIFTASPEYRDAEADPLDRWSRREIGTLARDWQGTAIFPSDGPPYAPFIRWATRSGSAWSSPVGLLVHAEAGLFISYRGAIALPHRLVLPAPPGTPCLTCATRPCETACPVGALGPDQGYDIPACKDHLSAPEGRDCMTEGCRVRRACPVARDFARSPAQSAFHMTAFMKDYRP